MNDPALERLRTLCGGPRDGALLRLSLARALKDAGDIAAAVEQLQRALEFDPAYSAAWRSLGQLQAREGRLQAAREAYMRGIEAAQSRGDLQAVREMKVFLARLDRAKA